MKIKSVKLLCGVCYRPEYSHNYLNISFLNNLQACFDQIGLEPNTFVVLLGDFNGHYDPGNPSVCSDFGSLLYRWLECNNLSQIINESTRITESGETILDLIITNSPRFFVNSGTFSPPANCYHCFIFGKIDISLQKRKCFTRKVWNFANVDVETLNSSLSNCDWESILKNHFDVDAVFEDWFSLFHTTIVKYVTCKS